MKNNFEPPDALVESILNGRCIAFVGAGFAAAVTPSWEKLLRSLSARLQVEFTPPEPGNALHYEAAGQRLRDLAGANWEPFVQQVLQEQLEGTSPETRAALSRRRELLLSIPFKAILTTNFDPSLQTSAPALGPDLYSEVLREERGRWWNAPPSPNHDQSQTPIIKLHGDANGLDQIHPLVLGRADYRRLVYGDRNYANFVRSAFAEYTVLFLGVSFTDAYLNELRSEALQLVYSRGAATPWGYAVLNKPTLMFRDFLRTDEGIETLPTETFDGFDDWLAAIAGRTSVAGRLNKLLAGKRVVWVDPNPQNNDLGRQLLSQTGSVESLTSPDQLQAAVHENADLILTNFGYDPAAAHSRAFDLLDRVRTW
ncbi:MAG: SIR2 family protein [Proteobacteria bacterium]|nr:SIR2 family protein [Pseudomonadota bacterium]